MSPRCLIRSDKLLQESRSTSLAHTNVTQSPQRQRHRHGSLSSLSSCLFPISSSTLCLSTVLTPSPGKTRAGLTAAVHAPHKLHSGDGGDHTTLDIAETLSALPSRQLRHSPLTRLLSLTLYLSFIRLFFLVFSIDLFSTLHLTRHPLTPPSSFQTDPSHLHRRRQVHTPGDVPQRMALNAWFRQLAA